MTDRKFPRWFNETEEPRLGSRPEVAPPITVREAAPATRPTPDADPATTPPADDPAPIARSSTASSGTALAVAVDGHRPASDPSPLPHATPAPARYVTDGHGTAIEVVGASKWFKDVVAVSDITCTIGYGVTALLGPNGAGKSTLFRMLCGLTSPSRGSVRVLGGNPRKQVGLTRSIGLVPQQEGVFEPLNAYEFVRLAGILHGLDDPGAAAVEALALVELDPTDTRSLTSYSKGMRQRVKVAQALVHDPEVLFLDEPLNGLDPRQRLHLVDLIQRLGDSGKCVVVSSHVLEEVERFSARVLVIVKGRLAAEGDFRAIRELMDDRPHRVSVRCSDARIMATGLMAHAGCAGVDIIDGQMLLIETNDVARFRHAVAAVAAHYGVQLLDVSPLDDDLESVFRYLVGP